MIVFPAIDLRGGRVVRLRQGRAAEETVYSDDPAAVARRWADAGAAWLHVVNLDGALGAADAAAGRNMRCLRAIVAAAPGARVQFGGGLRTLADVAQALEAGAARVVLGTAAVRAPELVSAAVRRFGPRRIAVAIDVRAGRVATAGWQEGSAVTPAGLGEAMRRRGVRYALYTDIRRDGLLTGVDVEGTAALAQATGLQVIASGGLATLDEVRRLRERAAAGIAGVIVGQALYCGALSLEAVLQAAG